VSPPVFLSFAGTYRTSVHFFLPPSLCGAVTVKLKATYPPLECLPPAQPGFSPDHPPPTLPSELLFSDEPLARFRAPKAPEADPFMFPLHWLGVGTARFHLLAGLPMSPRVSFLLAVVNRSRPAVSATNYTAFGRFLPVSFRVYLEPPYLPSARTNPLRPSP